jgi:hypothetical protein
MEHRRFTLLDGMVLIAALAVGLGSVRFVARRGPLIIPPWGWVAHGPILAAPCGVSLSVALLGLRFVKPRPPYRRNFRQPGTIACLVGALCPLTAAWPVLPLLGAIGLLRQAAEWEVLGIIAVLQCGAAVVVSWTVQALVGGRRTRRDWIERAGMAVGAYWVAANLATCVMIMGGWL